MAIRLPPGSFSWNPAGSTLAFHQSAHAVVHDQARLHGDPAVLSLKIIGRNVALVRDYEIARQVLDAGDHFSSRLAYSDLMAKYFSEPNILFEDTDEPDQARHKAEWQTTLADQLEGQAWTALEEHIRAITRRYRDSWRSSGQQDLYKVAKELVHELVMWLFLGLDAVEPARYKEAGLMCDHMLRGQFSLPVGINLGLWKSPHAKGMEAKRAFESRILKPQLQAQRCPFFQHQPPASLQAIGADSLQSHSLMFASSMVTKSLASMLAFTLLQLSRAGPGQQSLATNLAGLAPAERAEHLDAVQTETGRLCSAICGVMRRNKGADYVVETQQGKFRIPHKFDVWLYLPDIGRDRRIYGPTAHTFDATRFMQGAESPPDPLDFGGGKKACLGRQLVRKLVSAVVDELLWAEGGMKMDITGGEQAMDESLRDFLGWRGSDEPPVQNWNGVKQLPIQRPRDAVWVSFD